ncbi:MAG: homocysteine S-methyltransferase family protein [Candidatus Eiseniibacteriota bacterium]|nr:MAG: homocysteine S-methyltransferase family protein [Candidatus Eisenbacteria bacterium]
MRPFLEALGEEIIVADGATGTLLMAQGLPSDSPPEEWNLSRPEKVRDVHRSYLEAGARILTTNTLNANPLRLSEWKLDVSETNRRAVQIALEAAGDAAWVFGSVGPLGEFIVPLGEVSFEDARAAFREQVLCLVQAGVHGLIFETISDVKEMRALFTVAREVCSLPVIAQMSFGTDGRTVTGSPPEAVSISVSSLRPSVVGANCGAGLDDTVRVIEKFASLTSIPIIAQPNAGIPVLENDRPVFPATPDEMAGTATRLVEAGAAIVGGCCGSTPEHIRAVSATVAGRKPVARTAERGVKLCSRTRWVIAGESRPFVVIGERINPSRRRTLSGELSQGATRLLRQEAVRQVERGAHCLDLNVSVPDADEVTLMETGSKALERVSDVPVFVDSPDPAVIEVGLRSLPGKCVVNSVPCQSKKMEVLLPMAARFGAAIVALAVGEKGVAEDSSARIEMLERILEEAKKHGLGVDDILFDPAAHTLAVGPEQVRETLESLRILRSRGWTSVLGVSNVSHGMPGRSLINASFLAMAMEAGLDAAFLNPFDERIGDTVLASSALVRDDRLGKRFSAAFASAAGEMSTAGGGPSSAARPGREPPVPDDSFRPEEVGPEEVLRQSLLQGEKEDATRAAELLLDKGMNVSQLVENILVPTMRGIGERFEKGELFLPHIVLSAEAAQAVFGVLMSQRKTAPTPRGVVVIATVEGDVHDIGKNLVAMMLRTHGYEVFDLGKSVPADDVVEKAEEVKAQIVALSALLTTTMPRMGETAELLRARKTGAKVLVGGAPVSETFAKRIGAAYSPNAVEAVRRADELVAAKP